MAFWVLDNIDILSCLGILNIPKSKSLEKKGKQCWLFSLILHLWVNLRAIQKSNYQIGYLNKQKT